MMAEFEVFTDAGHWFDTVFFTSDYTADEVCRALIEHDGYPVNIYVKRVNR